jgi:hypothetical protein
LDAAQIEARFENELRSAIGHANFTTSSFLDLWSHIRIGTSNMVSQERTSERDMAEALSQLHVVLSEMEDQRILRQYAEYREDTVYGAFGNLCPGFWPFC